jgi:hypothetical protein
MTTARYDRIPNALVEWSTLLLRVREVPDSNLDAETDYPD